MRRAWHVILSILLLAPGGRAQIVQIALDGAADLSPVYVTIKIPANASPSLRRRLRHNLKSCPFTNATGLLYVVSPLIRKLTHPYAAPV